MILNVLFIFPQLRANDEINKPNNVIMHHALISLQLNERAALKFLLLVISFIVDDLIALWWYLSGYKESDDSEKVILEPKLIAIQGRIRAV